MHPALLFFINISLAICSLLWSYINFRNMCYVSVKSATARGWGWGGEECE